LNGSELVNRPFFWTTIPGASRTDENKATYGNIAKQVCFNFFRMLYLSFLFGVVV
jgi:hypothetical protein